MTFLTNTLTTHTTFQNKDKAEGERDAYEELLTHAELQGNINKINCKFNDILRSLDCFLFFSFLMWYEVGKKLIFEFTTMRIVERQLSLPCYLFYSAAIGRETFIDHYGIIRQLS